MEGKREITQLVSEDLIALKDKLKILTKNFDEALEETKEPLGFSRTLLSNYRDRLLFDIEEIEELIEYLANE